MSRRSWWIILVSSLVGLVGCGTDAEPAPSEMPPATGPIIRVPASTDPGAAGDSEATPTESTTTPQRLKDSEPGGCSGQTVFCWPVKGGCWLIGTVCSNNVLMCEYQCPPIVIEL